MRTIIKGKNIKLNYTCNEYSYYLTSHFYLMKNINFVESIRYELNNKKLSRINTYSKILSYEEYFNSEDVEFRLNIGEEFEGNIIERVEGIEDGSMVYYTDKIISTDKNLEEKEFLTNKLEGEIKEIEERLRNAIEIKIQIDKKAEEIKHNKFINTENMINKQIINNKKWYKFWK